MIEGLPADGSVHNAALGNSFLSQLEIFRSVLDGLADGVIVVNEHGKPLLSNPSAKQILRLVSLDLPPHEWPQAYGLHLPDQVTPYPPDDLPISRAMKGESVGPVEVFVSHALSPGGFWTSFSARPLRDASGAVRGGVLVVRDITAAKALENSLRQERDWATAIVDTAANLVIVLDRAGQIVGFNRACEWTTGYSFEEVKGRPLWDLLLTPEDAQVSKRIFEEMMAGRFPAEYESHWVTREGGRRLIAWSNTALLDKDGQVEFLIGTGLDITGRKQAEERLRLVNETLRALIEASPLPIWAHDLEGRVKFWNPAAERIFGWSEEEVLNRPLPIIPDDQQDDFRNLLERYGRGETLRGVERCRRKKDGSPIDISIWSAPLRDAQGKITAELGVIVDITERKQLEEQFRQAQKMEAIGRLAGGVAHDFNNLLMIISGYGQMLLDSLESDHPGRDNATEILKATESAAALTNRLLAFSRRQVAQPKMLDLNSVVVSMDKMLHRVIGEDIELITILCPNIGKVKMDPGQVEQVLMNLVVNSRDAMPQGGRITIETATVSFDENYARTHLGVRPGEYIMLAVSDTGKGMNSETMRHLFEPFFTTKEKGKGTGLGLSTVYGIVKQNGGDIWAYSEPGVGTTFKIYFPIAEACAETPQKVVAPKSCRRGSETILLAEDDAGLRRLIVEILRREGYTVLQAADWRRALQFCDEHSGPIHLFLTDVVMPGMSGRELAERVSASRPSLKVIYMSGYADNAIVRHDILNKGACFLQKPFTRDMLITAIRQVLDAG